MPFKDPDVASAYHQAYRETHREELSAKRMAQYFADRESTVVGFMLERVRRRILAVGGREAQTALAALDRLSPSEVDVLARLESQ